MTARAAHPDERASWLALFVVVGATWMVALDTTIVNVALHVIGDDLGGGGQVEWIVIAYLLAVCVSQPASGWLADRFGRSRVFLGSLVAFTIASAACAAAPTLPFLIGARVLQGLGGGAMMPVGMAIVFGLFPRERHGRALGVWGLAATLAPAIGPTLGGWLVTSVSWHWLFLINVPIGAVTFAMGVRLLPRTGDRHERPFDALGLFLGCGGLALVVLVLSEGNSWGWRSTAAVVGGAAGLAALAAFVVHELRVEHPLLELRMFRRQPFRVAIGIMMLLFVCQFARLVFIPLQLESLRGESALRVGLLFLPAALVAAVMMSIGGRIVDRRGARLPVVAGTVAVSLAVFSLSRLSLDTPLPVIAGILCVQGFGFGLSTPGVLVTGLSDLPSSLTAQGTALRSLLSQVAGAVAVALLSAVVTASAGPTPTTAQAQAGFNDAFTVAVGCALLAVVLAFRVPRRPPVYTVEALDETLVLD